MPPVLLRLLRLATASLILAAVVVQFLHPADPLAVAANFLSFFTIQSNLIAAGVLIVVAVVGGRPRTARVDALRGAATLYLVITGVVFALLLSNVSEDLQLTLPWVDTVLHRVAPLVLALDWLVDPPRSRITRRTALLWLVYPAAWATYTLVRGAITGWYPYPFIDVNAHGYPAVLLTCVVLLVAFVLAALAVAAVGNRLGSRPAARRRAPR